MAEQVWANVAVAFQSALAAADTITALTKANPGVATSTAHGLTNGQYVRLTASGMYQVDGRIFRVANVTANTFELEGEDTTNYATFVSGTAEQITFGTTLGSGLTVNVSGGEPEFADVTTIHDSIRRRIPTVTSPLQMAIEAKFDLTDAALTALRAAAATLSTRACLITFSNGWRVAFNGFVSASGFPTGSQQDVVKTNLSIEGQGRPSYYTT
jgi:Phage tail tube protein, TTP